MKRVKELEINYLGFAAFDNLGRVFEYKGKILRGIYPEKQAYVRAVFRSGLVKELIKKQLLVETKVSDYHSDSYPLILEHKKLTTSLPTDWTFSMLKDAAKVILRMNNICNKFGYELSDAHPYNLCFDGSQCKWIDFGSIKLREHKEWIAREEFVNYTIAPLVFMANNKLLLAYTSLQAERTFKLYSKPFRESVAFGYFLEIMSETSKSFRNEMIDITWINKLIQAPDVNNQVWGNYQAANNSIEKSLINHDKNRFHRFFKLPQLVKRYAKGAKTALDLAGNIGVALFILNKDNRFEKMINIDYDPLAIEKSYKFLKKHPKLNVESYVVNFMLPMQQDSIQNFKSDIVFALAVTHHLLLTQGFKIEGVFEKIKEYSNKYVFIEFMPLGLWNGDPNHKPETPDWYTLDWFRENFKKHFELIKEEVLESHEINKESEAHRVLFIGKIPPLM